MGPHQNSRASSWLATWVQVGMGMTGTANTGLRKTDKPRRQQALHAKMLQLCLHMSS
jgi:hypothetical protein